MYGLYLHLFYIIFREIILFDIYILMKVYDDMMKLCTPAKIYVFFAMISIIMYIAKLAHVNVMARDSDAKSATNSYSIMALIFKIVLFVAWTLFLNFLCAQGYTTLAWIMLLFPFLVFLLLLVALFLMAGVAAAANA